MFQRLVISIRQQPALQNTRYLSASYFHLYHHSHLVLQHSYTPHLSKGLSWIIGVEQWLIRHVFLIMPRTKCLCPYSALAMVGHASSVERLYPTVGKHELQSSLHEAPPP